MNPRRRAIAALLAISVAVGAGTTVTLRSTPDDGTSAASPSGDGGTSRTSTGAQDVIDGPPPAYDVAEPHDAGNELAEHAHPEPFDPSDDRTLRAHRRAVVAFIEAAHTFLPDDELGALHHRATNTLHPDANEHDAGVVVTSVPPPGHTRQVDVMTIDLAIDTGSRTMWTITTQLVEIPSGGGPAMPVDGHSPVTSQVAVTDWLETPLVLEQTVDPDPVP